MGQRTQVLIHTKFTNQLGETRQYSNFLHYQWGFARTMAVELIAMVTSNYYKDLPMQWHYAPKKEHCLDNAEFEQKTVVWREQIEQDFVELCQQYTMPNGHRCFDNLDAEHRLFNKIHQPLTQDLIADILDYGDNNDGFLVVVVDVKMNERNRPTKEIRFGFIREKDVKRNKKTYDITSVKFSTAKQYMKQWSGNYGVDEFTPIFDSTMAYFDVVECTNVDDLINGKTEESSTEETEE